jgi:hypothetical protein
MKYHRTEPAVHATRPRSDLVALVGDEQVGAGPASDCRVELEHTVASAGAGAPSLRRRSADLGGYGVSHLVDGNAR